MKNFQLRHIHCDSIILPEKFFLGSCKYLSDLPSPNRILLTGPGIYPQIYHRTPCLAVLICKGSNKQQKRGGIIPNLIKGGTLSSLITTKCSWG